jgi:hypothetical protein
MATLSTTFEPALPKRVKNEPYAARRRFAGEFVRPADDQGKGKYTLLSTSNIYRTGGLAARPGSCRRIVG